MLSRDQEYDVTSGSEVVLDCEFHMDGYRMFDNPTVWEKNQLDERTRVNIMGVVQEPFASTRRFEVVFVEQKPRYCLRLTIQGTSSCVLSYKQSVCPSVRLFSRLSVYLLSDSQSTIKKRQSSPVSPTDLYYVPDAVHPI